MPAVTRAMALPWKGRHVGHGDALAQGGEEDQDQGKAEGGAKAVNSRCHQPKPGLEVEQGHGEHGAVDGDEGQKDAQDLVQHRAGLAHHRLG